LNSSGLQQHVQSRGYQSFGEAYCIYLHSYSKDGSSRDLQKVGSHNVTMQQIPSPSSSCNVPVQSTDSPQLCIAANNLHCPLCHLQFLLCCLKSSYDWPNHNIRKSLLHYLAIKTSHENFFSNSINTFMFHNSHYHLHFFETLHVKMFFRHS